MSEQMNDKYQWAEKHVWSTEVSLMKQSMELIYITCTWSVGYMTPNVWSKSCLPCQVFCIVYLKFVQYRCRVVLFPGVYIWYLYMIFIYTGNRMFIFLLYFIAYIIHRMYVCYIWNIPWNCTFMNCLVKESYKWVC